MAITRNANRRRRLLLLSPPTQVDDEDDVLTLESLEPAETVVAPSGPVRTFGNACGSTGPIWLRVTGPEMPQPKEYRFDTPFVVTGHSRKADLRLEHPDVSLRHSYLQVVDGRLYCVDLHSRTGTSAQDNSGRGEAVAVEDTIHIGPFQIDVLDGDHWEEPDGAEESDSGIFLGNTTDELARVTVEVLNGDKRKRFRAIENTITLVGNAPGSKLRLRDKSISKTHCALVRTPAGLWCVDLLGKGGTRINGSAIRFGQLRDGDLLQIGKARIRMHDSHIDDVAHTGEQLYQAEATSAPSHSEQQPVTDAAVADAAVANAAVAAHPASGISPQMPLGNLPMPTLPSPAPAAQLPQTTGETPAAERQVSEAFVMTLVNQFGEMQQQMFQQSQQAMMMLVNMFGTLHQNHMDLIRDDLNRIYEITGELQTVQAQIVAGQSATNVYFTREQQPAHEDGVQDAVISNPAEKASPEAASQKPLASLAPPQAKSPEASPAEKQALNSKPEENKPRDRSGVRTHAWLNEQLSSLEGEREGRWKKIMDTIKGIGGGV